MPKSIIPALCLFMGLAGGALFGIFAKESDFELSSATSSRDDTAVSGGSVRRTNVPVIAPPTAALPPEVVDDAKRAIAPDVTETPKGTAEIRGSITTTDGRPLPGALVRLEIGPPADNGEREDKTPSVGLARPVDPGLDATLKMVMIDHFAREKSRVDTPTDASGRFRFDGLDASRNWRVRAAAEGYRVQLAMGSEEYWGPPGAGVDFIATPVHRLPVTVSLEDGTVPDLAIVRISREGGSFFHESPWTAERNVVEAVAGLLRVSAGLPNREDMDTEPVLIDLPTRDPSQLPVKLTLRPRLRIRGRLIYSEGEVPTAVNVAAVLMRGAQTLPDEAFPPTPLQAWVAERNVDFTIEGELSRGKYGLAVLRNQAIIARTEVELSSGTTWVELTMPPLSKADFVVVKVLNPRGELMRDVGVWDQQLGENGIPRSDGTYWVPRRRSKGSAEERRSPEQSMLSISSQTYGSLSVDYSPLSSSEVTAQFEEPASLVVEVAGYTGSRFEGKLSVSMQIDAPKKRAGRPAGMWDGGFYGHHRSTQVNGKWTYSGLQPDFYDISLYCNSEQSSILVEHVRKQLSPGPNQVIFSLPALHTVVVDIGEAIAETISVASQSSVGESSWIWSNTDASGRATFEVLAGTYAVSRVSESEEYCSVVFTAPTSDVVRLEKARANGLEITASQPEGLTSLGLKIGDVIVGTSKGRWTGNPSAKLNSQASSSAVISLKVLRGGSEIDVGLDGTKFNMARWKTNLRAVAR